MKIFLKPGISILFDKKTGLTHFSISTSNIHKIYEITPEYMLLFKLLNSISDADILFDRISESYPNFNKKEFFNTLNELHSEGILAVVDFDINSYKKEFSQNELIRYNRQVKFFGDLNLNSKDLWSYQYILKKSTVLILGVGGLGSWVAEELAMAGIGHLILCDFDKIELHNLTRQALYTTNDIGLSKSLVLKKKLIAINQNVKITSIDFKLTQKKDLNNIRAYFKQADCVINCADYPDINTTSTWISELCMMLKKIHIIGGGYNGHTGLIGPTIIPYKTPCWNCLQEQYSEEMSKYDFQTISNTRKTAGASVFLTSIVASIHAWECIRAITNVTPPFMAGKIGFWNSITYELKLFPFSKKKSCKLCNCNHRK